MPQAPSLGCHGGRKLRRCSGHMCRSEQPVRVVSGHIWNTWLPVLACHLLSQFYHCLPLILLTAPLPFNFSPQPHPHVLYEYACKHTYGKMKPKIFSLLHIFLWAVKIWSLPFLCAFSSAGQPPVKTCRTQAHHTLLLCYSEQQHMTPLSALVLPWQSRQGESQFFFLPLVFSSFPGTRSVVLITRSVITIMLLAVLLNWEFTFSFMHCEPFKGRRQDQLILVKSVQRKTTPPITSMSHKARRTMNGQNKRHTVPEFKEISTTSQLVKQRLSHCTRKGLEG